MLKIGITTYYFDSHNFGGLLQSYALCHYLAKNNYTAEQLCISSDVFPKQNYSFFQKIFKWKAYGNLLKRFWNKFAVRCFINDVVQQRKSAFVKFREQIPHSAFKYDSLNIYEANHLYDIFITGSDRVWNPKNKIEHPFFLIFAGQKPKISYAASLTSSTLSDSEKNIFRTILEDYVAISVREKGSVSLLQNLAKVDVVWTLDPTGLLSQKEWDEICSERIVSEKYIFCYFLGSDSVNRRVAKAFAKEKGLVIVTLPYSKDMFYWSDVSFGNIRLFGVSPQQFLSLIKYAEYVFTDSFHATIFSTLYQKEYFVFERGELRKSGSRIESLTALCHTESRYCNTKDKKSCDYLSNLSPIDYNLVSEELERMRVKSEDFLRGSLKICEKKLNKKPFEK